MKIKIVATCGGLLNSYLDVLNKYQFERTDCPKDNIREGEININTIEELYELYDNLGIELIIRNHIGQENIRCIEIYDDYR